MTDTPQTTTPQKPQTGPLARELNIARSLYTLARELSSTLTSQEVMARAVRGVVTTMGVTHATISLYDKSTGSGVVVIEYPAMGSLGAQFDRNGNPTLRRMETDPAPVVIPDMANGREALGDTQSIAESLGIKSMLLVSIRYEGELLGAIGIDAYHQRYDFTELQVEGVQVVADQVGIALHNSRIYEEIQRKAQQIEAVSSFGGKVLASLDRTQILQTVTQELATILPADGVSISLHAAGETNLYIYLLTTNSPRPTIIEFNYEDTALRFLYNSGESLLLEDISTSNYPDYQVLVHHAAPDSWEGDATTMHSAIIMPLRAAGTVIGTLNLTRTVKASFTPDDLNIAEQLASQLAIALENARIYAQAAERVQIEQLMNRLSSNTLQADMQVLVTNTMREIGTALNARVGRVRLQMPTIENLDAAKLRRFLDSQGFGSKLKNALGASNKEEPS